MRPPERHPAAGTTLNGDCTLSGTPTTAGSKPFVTRVADSGGLFLNVGTTQTVLSAVRVTTTTLRPPKANTSYTTTLAVTGGKPPYTWSLAGGSLPVGLNLSATGVVSGTSGGLGVSAFTVRATDGLGGFDDQALQLAVNLGPLSATCAPPIGEVGVAYSQPACLPKLGLPPYTCALLSGIPATGTTLNSDCTLSGTPTTAGSKPFVTRVADSGGLFLNVGTTQTVLPAVQVTTTTLPPLKANTPYTTTLAVTGGKPPYAWSLAGGSLPVGLHLSGTGVMSGASGVGGVSAFTIRATDGLGGFDDQALQLAVNLGPLGATCAPPIGEVGVAYSQPACVPTLGLPPYTCALLSGTPATGTTLNGDCRLSGTPTAAGSKTFVIRVADSGGLFLNVNTTQTVLPAVQITTSSVAAATLNTSFTTTLMATGGKPGYTWSVASGTLPAGLGLSAGGILSGTPITAGISNVTFRATDTLGGFDNQALQLAVILGPLSATCAPPIGEVGVAYSQPACVPTLGLPPYTCALLSGTPATGTTLNGDCRLSGTPTVAGSKTFMTRVADSGGLFLNVSTTQTVLPAVQITTSSVAAATLNESFTITLMATGGKPGYTWSVASGTLPAGLGLSVGGILSGTPITAGISNVTFRATDTLGGFDNQALQLAVTLGPLSATCAPPIGEVGVAYNQPACVPTLGLPPYTCALLSGTPATGTTLNGDCTLSGTPTVAGSKTFVTRVADSGGLFLYVSTTQTVLPAVQVTTTTLPPLTANTSYTTTLAATGGKLPYTWSLAGGSLPVGLTLSATGVMSGTSGGLGVSTVTVRATDGLGGFDDQALQLAVTLGPLGATCVPPIGEVGVAYSQPACVPTLGLPPYTCALLSGTPAAGTTLNGDCTLSGTPTVAGSKTFTTRVADSGGLFLNVSTTQTVLPAVQITTSSVAAATLNTSFTTTLMATGGKPNYTWSVASGTLPAGLGLSAGGILSGTPTAAGISDVTFRATDTLGGFDDQALQLTVNLGPLSATCTAAPSSVNVAYTTTCSGTGGLPPYSCTLGSGTPPNGIGINTDCTVTGTPTVVGSKTFVVKLTDSAGASANASLTINPANHVGIATNSLPVGKVGTSYSTTLTFTPSVSPYTWSIVDGGPLPADLSLNTATGAITGTPQPGSDGAYPITFRVTDGAGGTADKVLTLTILNTQSLGQWAGPFESPIVSVHGALLRNGTVVLWDALDSGNYVHIWNPASNTFTATANSRSNIFCSGHCTLRDGRIFVAGGHVTTHVGLLDANIFDPGPRQPRAAG